MANPATAFMLYYYVSLLLTGYLGYALLMASAVEWSCQELIYNGQSQSRLNKAGRHYQNIGIVMGTGQSGQFHLPAYS